MRSVVRFFTICWALMLPIILLTGCPQPPTQYTLSVAVDGEGTVSPAAGTHQYAADNQVTLTATPDAGWRFESWSGGVTGSENPTTITITSNVSITANFVPETAPDTFQLSVEVIGEGTVNLAPAAADNRYEVDTLVTMTAVPEAGWEFTGWSGAITGQDNPGSVLIIGDLNVTATFEPIIEEDDYSLTIDIVGDGSVSVDPELEAYEADTEVSLLATPAAGSQFIGWSGDLESLDNPLVITITANTQLTATFESTIPEGKSAAVGITGWLTDTTGAGIPFAEVRLMDGTTVYTNAEGLYLFGELDAANEVTIFFSKEGYTANSRTVDVLPGATTSANASLKRLADPVVLSNVQEGGTVDDGKGNAVILPANALVNGENKSVAGDVEVRITALDITDAAELTAFPGDFRAIAAGKSDDVVQLETFALADFQFTQGEEPLNLAPGTNATIQLQLPENTPLFDGEVVPLWYYDEDLGIWIEDGNGVVESDGEGGFRYTADVGHFSWWNCDKPITETHSFSGTVEDNDGQPVSGANVTADGVDYTGSSSATTDSDGNFCVNVKRNATVEIRVTLPGSTIVADAIVVESPDVAASCAVGGGSSLERPLSADFDSAVQGEVRDPSGLPVPGIDVFSSFGGRAVTDEFGAFCLGAPADKEVTVFAAGRFPVKVTTLPNTSCTTGDAVFVVIEVSYPEDGDHVGILQSIIGQDIVWTDEDEVMMEGLSSFAFFFAHSLPGNMEDWFADIPNTCELEIYDGTPDSEFEANFEFMNLVDVLDPGTAGVVAHGENSATMIRLYDFLQQFGMHDMIETSPYMFGMYMQSPDFLPGVGHGDTVTYSWPGGLDIDAFAIDVPLPGALNVTNPVIIESEFGLPTTEIDFENDLEILWDASVPGDLIEIEIRRTVFDLMTFESTYGAISCLVQDTGSHTISADLLSQLADISGNGLVYVTTNFEISRKSLATVPVPLRNGGEGNLTVITSTDIQAQANGGGF